MMIQCNPAGQKGQRSKHAGISTDIAIKVKEDVVHNICGLGEINFPSLQPGSSIMPCKVNPVIPGVVLQVAAQVMANDAAIAFVCQGSCFELNTMTLFQPSGGENMIALPA
jgi:fumarate hydratase class II